MKTILQGLACALAMAVLDAKVEAQNLYIPLMGSGVPLDFAQVNTNGLATGYQTDALPTTYAIYPLNAVFDSAGDLYVACVSNIVELTNDNGTLSTNLTPFNQISAFALAFDRAGDLFASGSTDIVEFVNDGGTLSTNPIVFAPGPVTVYGLAFDRAGNLYAACENLYTPQPNGYIAEYATNGTESILCTNLASPLALAFDGAGNLYVTVSPFESLEIPPLGNPVILEISTNGSQSVYLRAPYGSEDFYFGLAFDNRGVLYANMQSAPSSPEAQEVVKFTTPGNPTRFFYFLDITNRVGWGDYLEALAFEPVPLLQPAATNGNFQLTVTAPSPYYETIVQSSTNLVNWRNAYTNIPPFVFTDSLTNTACFYRAVLDTNSF